MQQKQQRPTAIFSIYAPSDIDGLERWEAHLHTLEQARALSVWSARHLQAGFDRGKLLQDHLDQADLIVLLLSADFFTDDECIALMEHALAGKARVIPLLLRSVDWQTSKLADLTCLPANGQFVTTWDNLDVAFHACVDDLRQVLGLPALPPQTRKPPRGVALQDQNRVLMLRRLRRSYRDLMSQSLQGAAWLELGIAERPGAVQNATNLLLRVPNHAEQLLLPGTSIIQAYDEAEHELLILGEPGAGKSTLLLDLAQQLVERAEHDETHPLPVILPLSTFAARRPKLADWLAEQLAEIYDIPRKLSMQWVQEDRILPLLDGLDEMEETARPVCIAAINTYHREHLMPLVVCSRTAEYEAATSHHRLALQGAVVVQPLTHEHVDAYLVQAGKTLAALRRALKKNMALYESSTTPLMLNILILTYQGSSVRELPRKEAALLQQVWQDYVERMVMRKGDGKRYPLSETRAWLSWLALQMRDHNQTIFYLEHLQPDWLTAFQQRTYTWFAVRLPAIVIGILISVLVALFFIRSTDPSSLLQNGLLGGFLGGLWRGPGNGSQGKQRHTWGKQLAKRLAISACVGLIYGLSFGFDRASHNVFNDWLIDGLSPGMMMAGASLLLQYLLAAPFRSHLSPEKTTSRGWKRALRFFEAVQGPRALLVATITGLSVGLSTGLSVGLSTGLSFGLSFGLSDGLNDGLSIGVSSALISLTLGVQTGDIHLTERMRWNWKSMFKAKHLGITAFLTCVSIIFVGLSYGLIDEGIYLSLGVSIGLSGVLGDVLSIGLSVGLSYWLVLGLIQGMTQERIEDQDRRVVNQGIHRSLRNSVIMSIVCGTIIGCIGILSEGLRMGLNGGLVIGLSYGLSYGLSEGLRVGLGVGLSVGLSKGLSEGLSVWLSVGLSAALLIYILTGGLAVWRHFVIRFLLQRSHTFPWRAPQFLNDASTRFLLRRIGGGYSFTHRLLLDHLADATERGRE
jgi:hypothetical protein